MKAGQSTRDMELKRYLLRGGLVLLAIFLLWGGLHFLNGKNSWGGILFVLVLIKAIDVVATHAINHVHRREKDAGRGAAAEEKVGDILALLDKDRFQVFHDRAFRYGNIDHLVLRNDGALFVIETKSHTAQITAENGVLLRSGQPFEKDFIRQTLGNTMGFREHVMGYAEDELYVTGIICFTRGFVEVRGPIKGIHVIPAKWLLENLDKGKANPNLAEWLWEHAATLVTLPPKTPVILPEAQ